MKFKNNFQASHKKSIFSESQNLTRSANKRIHNEFYKRLKEYESLEADQKDLHELKKHNKLTLTYGFLIPTYA